MSKASAIARKLLEAGPDVVVVYEDGTHDPHSALYINGKLIEVGYTNGLHNVVTALGHKPKNVFVARGFDGNFPEKLSQVPLIRSSQRGLR